MDSRRIATTRLATYVARCAQLGPDSESGTHVSTCSLSTSPRFRTRANGAVGETGRFTSEASSQIAVTHQPNASYALRIATFHPFNHGNTRAAFITSAVFLELNGYDLTYPEPEVVRVMQALAATEMHEPQLAQSIREGVQSFVDR